MGLGVAHHSKVSFYTLPRAGWRMATLAWLTTCALLATAPAQAGLFDDEEARKAIVDLRARLVAVDDSAKARQAEQTGAIAKQTEQLAQLQEQLGALRRSLLELNNQLEAARNEIAKLRGADEQMGRDVAELQKKQRDVGQSLDDRLRRVEPVKLVVDGRELLVSPDEKSAYEEAMATLRTGDFDKATAALAAFARRFAGSSLAESARFWLGNAQYGRRDLKEAMTTFRAFVATSPDHPRAPEALLALANSQAETKDPKAARTTLQELLKSYPQSEAAVAGKERLAAIK
jgi:tol-pal system protein YbgF